MPINRSRLDFALLHARVQLLEMIVLRLGVVIRAHRLDRASKAALIPALSAQEAELESMASALEASVASIEVLTGEERALFADEAREMLEQMKATVRQLFEGI